MYSVLCLIACRHIPLSHHNSCVCRTPFDIASKRAVIAEHEARTADVHFWHDNERATRIMRELEDARSDVERFDTLRTTLDDIAILQDLATTDAEKTDVAALVRQLEEDLRKLTLYTYFSGTYDAHDAIITIVAGAGGVDAQDWADMLGRMYLRWAERKDYHAVILDRVDGAEAGIKSMTIEVRGRWAYGWARADAGVHRLVRLSPFNADNLRQTSFARVEVLPIVHNDLDVHLAPEDLRIDTYRASGAGGQHVNTTDSAVRITHLPTGLQAQCQNERSQGQNKEAALRLLRAQLLQRRLAEQAMEQNALRGEVKDAQWGSQIRSYVVHPYKMVKDHRTKHETTHVDAVLDGDLEAFMTAYLMMMAQGQ